jgi:hypothetical protein
MAATKLRLYQDVARLLGDARFALITDDVETRYALDDAWDEAVTFVLRQAPWRYALATATLVASVGTPAAGYAHAYDFPADWLRTHAIFLSASDGREDPIDLRDQATIVSVNVGTAPKMRFVSAAYADPALAGHPWPEHFAQCVAAYLAFLVAERVTGERSAAGRMSQLFSELLPEAVRLDAVPEDPWLVHQRSGAMLRAARDLLARADWRFALKDAAISVTAGTPAAPFLYSYAQPADWLRTHRLFLPPATDTIDCPFDVREQGGYWSTNATAFNARYVSATTGADSTLWPEPFRAALRGYLAAGMPGHAAADQQTQDQQQQAPQWQRDVALAIQAAAEPPDDWLAYQLSGKFQRAAHYIARQAYWRFGLKDSTITVTSGTPIGGFAHSYAHPNDWLRTHKLVVVSAGRECPIDIREQGGFWSTDAVSFTARYVSSTLALDTTRWPEPMRRTVFLLLRSDGQDDPDQQPASAPWRLALNEARAGFAEPEHDWLRFQLSGAFRRAAGEILTLDYWRFAIATASPTAGGSSVPGYSSIYVIPSDHLRTHALFLSAAGGREFPVDAREQGGTWLANNSAITVRYVSKTRGLDATLWGEPFAKAVRAYLMAEEAAGSDRAEALSKDFAALLNAAQQTDTLPEDPWLAAQLDGTFDRASRAVIGRAFWRFALKDATISATSGTAAAGFAHSFAVPADWLRSHKLFVLSGSRECPIDAREEAGFWSTNIAEFRVRYLSSTLAFDSRLWPGPVEKAVRVFVDTERATEKPAEDWRAYAAEAERGWTEAEWRWLDHALSGRMRDAAQRLLEAEFWRFALKTVVPSATSGAVGGFARAFAQPADWLRTHAIFVAASGRELPVDVREHETRWSTNAAALTVRYVSNSGLDATLWPQQFETAVGATLDAEIAPPDKAADATALAKLRVEEARGALADPPNRWLPYQLDGSFESARYDVLRRGFWAFRGDDGVMYGLKEVQLSAPADQLVTQPDYSMPYRYPLPADWLRTHALFVPWDGQNCPINISESAQDWSTDAPVFVARYVATDVLDPQRWPRAVEQAVLAYLDWRAAPAEQVRVREAEFDRLLDEARALHARPADDWLRFQLSGAYQASVKQMLEQGRWRFAIKTKSLTETTDPLPAEEADGGVSDSYGYRFIWPNDLLRTLRVYYLRGSGTYAERCDIDYRDEGGAFHANYTPITVRYVSRLGLDSTKWSAHFRDAALAWLQYQEARADPAKTGIAQAKLMLYEAACREAERQDDARDRPARKPSRLVMARYGRSSINREQGWP